MQALFKDCQHIALTRTTGDEEESFLATFGGGTGVTGGLFSGTVTVQFCIQGL